jgi:hypothetical protein
MEHPDFPLLEQDKPFLVAKDEYYYGKTDLGPRPRERPDPVAAVPELAALRAPRRKAEAKSRRPAPRPTSVLVPLAARAVSLLIAVGLVPVTVLYLLLMQPHIDGPEFRRRMVRPEQVRRYLRW